ncbi:MAG: beta-lactamase family protein [Roseivirga sp.]|nr:beta-lactamase family protein [Roseivirga sp.]
MHLLKIAFIFLLITLSVTGLYSQSNLASDLDTYLEVIAAKKSFSGELLVARGNEVVFHKAIGMKSVEDAIPLKKGAVYRIASITKTFTGTLVAMAQQRGKLSYTDKVGDYIPGLTRTIGDLTIHQLLTHTSGLPHNEGIEDYWLKKSKLELSSNQVISEINKLELLFEPGAEMKYSSPGYYLLGTLVEKVYDQPYQQVLTREILTPLGMTESGSDDSDKLVRAYHLLQEKRLPAPYRHYSMLKGAGDMHATAEDLLKWSRSFYAKQLLGSSGIKTVLNPELTYAYGWFVGSESPAKFYHGGGTWGYSSYLAIYPSEEISIIILSNVSSLPMKAIGADLEKMVYGLPFDMPVIEQSIEVAEADLERYEGTYLSETSEMRLEIKKNGNALFAQIGGSPAFQIYPKGNDTFFGKKVEVTMTFEPKGAGISGVKAERMGRTFAFKKRG